jgi:protein O-mannosyl-transferase
LGGGFLSFDDEAHLLNNAAWREPGALRWALGLNWVHWYPLTWASFALDHALWGLKPFGYHLTAVLLHAVNAALAFFLFDRLLEKSRAPLPQRRAAAAFGALLFALHPLRAESVAWVTERSDLLSGGFILGTALAWLHGRPGLAALLHGLGLAAKGVGAPLPVVFALVDALGAGRPWPGAKREARDLAPLLGLSLFFGLMNVAAQRGAGALWSLSALGPLERAAIGGYGLWRGLAATLGLETPNAFIAMPKPFDAAAPRFLLAAAVVLGLTALAWTLRRKRPAFTAAWSAYVLLSIPLVGFLKNGPQLAADRYFYAAGLGLTALPAAGLAAALSGKRRRAAAAAALLLLAGLGARAWERQGDWLDSERLWSSVLAAQPDNILGLHFLAIERLKKNDLAAAEPLLRRGAELDPGHAPTRNSLANLLARSGRDAEALEHYAAAIRLDPARPEPRYNAAVSLARLGRRAEALAAARELAARHPELARASALVESLEPPRRKKIE